MLPVVAYKVAGEKTPDLDAVDRDTHLLRALIVLPSGNGDDRSRKIPVDGQILRCSQLRLRYTRESSTVVAAILVGNSIAVCDCTWVAGLRVFERVPQVLIEAQELHFELESESTTALLSIRWLLQFIIPSMIFVIRSLTS